jgi:hypothetical protein
MHDDGHTIGPRRESTGGIDQLSKCQVGDEVMNPLLVDLTDDCDWIEIAALEDAGVGCAPASRLAGVYHCPESDGQNKNSHATDFPQSAHRVISSVRVGDRSIIAC